MGLWILVGEREPELVLPDLPGRAAPFGADLGELGMPYALIDAADLRPAAERPVTFNTGIWADTGLFAERDGRRESFALSTPLVEWFARYPTVLPGDLVVWQFGPHIAVLDYPRRLVGVLAEGHGPVVVWEEAEPAAPT
jgi:hypothetical protein